MRPDEQSFYDIPRLHRVFAAASLALLAVTLWMFADDHFRPWKGYQRQTASLEARTARWVLLAGELDQAAGRAAGADKVDPLQYRSTWWTWDRGFPLPGRRWLELPVLDAFNAPRKIETIWSDDLTRGNHTAEVLRFDRCTTCHQRMARGWPGDAQRPLFPPARLLTLRLHPAPADPSDPSDPTAELAPQEIVELRFGLRLAAESPLGDEQATVVWVRSASPAAEARPATEPPEARSGARILAGLLGPDSHQGAAEDPPGLWMGDMIEQIDGQPAGDLQQVLRQLAGSGHGGQAVALTVRRGLPHPFAAHPRLDLFVGSSSPHPLADFGCTVCHGGQGSATDFAWASHTPDSNPQRTAWREAHRWFDNPEWPEPMLPSRFVESSCLKCHHRVLDLEPRPGAAQPPAAKLLRGYQLILSHGCYGCHEIQGYADGRSQGPDLRLESAEGGDGEPPGQLRKVGPSLTRLASKLDSEYIIRWLHAPRQLRPGTRMPHFFGVWDHIEGEHLDAARAREAVEVQAITRYLADRSEEFPYPLLAEPAADSQRVEQVERGRELFQIQGCLVCHSHRDFPEAEGFREPQALVSGPDLSDLGAKLRGESGRRWLAGWIRDPAAYDPSTTMPSAQFPQQPAEADREGSPAVQDPVDDLVAYLLSGGEENPGDQNVVPPPRSGTGGVDADVLDQLVTEHLEKSFPATPAAEYRQRGIPERLRPELRADERELVVLDADRDRPGFQLDEAQKLRYLGRRSIRKYGCSGCHEIPGFENAPGIGVPLTDWGRKDPRMLLFDHVAEFAAERVPDAGWEPPRDSRPADDAPWYVRQLVEQNRIGFLHQKLAHPRSFDYRMLAARPWNERQRMPQFSFSAEDREAIMTFVLGLVAQPPRPRYVAQPDERRLAQIEGRRVLDRYSCRGCHVLQGEQWEITYPPGTFGAQQRQPTFAFAEHSFDPAELEASERTDRRGLRRTVISGQPAIGDQGLPVVFDDFGDELFEDELYEPGDLEFAFQLWRPAALDGYGYQVGEAPLVVTADRISSKIPSDGGFLPRYLLPHVVRREQLANPRAKGSQAWGWLPPPLDGVGRRVQPAWLHRYLLDPHPVRPAVLMRMPRYRLSEQEAETLARYFAAAEGLPGVFDAAERRHTLYLEEAQRQYARQAAAAPLEEGELLADRLDQALQIVVNKNYCITCHVVGDYDPDTADRERAPDLAAVHHRLRAQWLRQWIARPMSLLPYTPMPVNVPYLPGDPHGGGVDQRLYPGSSVQQVDALVDLLLNFDRYAGHAGGVQAQVERP